MCHGIVDGDRRRVAVFPADRIFGRGIDLQISGRNHSRSSDSEVERVALKLDLEELGKGHSRFSIGSSDVIFKILEMRSLKWKRFYVCERSAASSSDGNRTGPTGRRDANIPMNNGSRSHAPDQF